MKHEPAQAEPSHAGLADPSHILALFAGCLLLPLALLAIGRLHHQDITTLQLLQQDVWLLFAGLVLVAIAAIPIGPQTALPPLTGEWVAGLALAIAVIGYVGHYWILDGFDLSRDEQMASFDTFIYRAGRMVWPLPAAWQGSVNLLNAQFLVPVDRPVAWVSAYLPGNSMLRALAAWLGDAALTGPLLNGLSVWLTWLCARRIWPGNELRDREPASVAVVVLALSGQVVMTGMSAYAMSAHLCCNLLWLALFLRDRRSSDIAALAVGFVAVGLHEPLFHPLFVAPFLALLLYQRRWDRLLLFCPVYLLIAGFWFAWPHLTLAWVSGPHSAIHGPVGFYARLNAVLAEKRDNLPIMAANLLRFVTWQHLLLLPLLIAGFIAARRQPLALALAAGFILPIVLLGVLEPRQGHGFGYRYVHDVMGNAALLGGFGWQWLDVRFARLRPLFLRASLASLLGMLPLQMALTHAVYRAYARVDARINASHADYIIIGEDDAPLALDLVYNRPDLGNRPIRLVAAEIADVGALAQHICHSSPPRVTMALVTDAFYSDLMRFYGWPARGGANARLPAQASAFRADGCNVRELS